MIRNVIAKVTLGCNIDCRYCYVQRNRNVVSNQVMDAATLEALVRRIGEYLKQSPVNLDEFIFYWHGGEPLLAGRPFFERAMQLQRQHLPSGMPVINTIQTNGLLLDREWVRLIRSHNIGLCLSLDGPPEINDHWRITKNGKGTHNLVMRSIEMLRREGVPLSILSVVTPEALPHGASIYRGLRDLGCGWMDFMYPFYSSIDNTLDEPIEPERWGHFLVDVFDAWMAEGNPDVEVRMLRDICLSILGGRTKMCISSEDCSYVITVNPSGDVYICDDLLAYSDSRLGNLHKAGIDELSKNPRLLRLADKNVLFGAVCRSCDGFEVCKGGCTLFRAQAKDDFHGRHFYCAAQKIIIAHIATYLGKPLFTAAPAPRAGVVPNVITAQ